MNIKFDFTETGGLPLDQDILNDLQNGTLLVDGALASLLGPLAVISGCAVVGGSAANGVVAINGEVLPFIGGPLQTKVIVVETTANLTYFDDVARPSQITRYATFGDDGVQNNPWANFKNNTTDGILNRLMRLEWLTAPDRVTGGSMRFWNKPANEIPAGWQEVTDFAGRFPMGRKLDGDGNEIVDFGAGDTGGAETHTLTISELPPLNEDNSNTILGLEETTGGAGSHSWPSGTQKQVVLKNGGGQAHSILNPYRIVIFIEPIPGYIA